MYFNTVQFSGNAYGIKSAASVFFSKSPKDLNPNESAVLVGMLKGITLFNPVKNPEKSLSRRNTVLAQCYKYDFITKKQLDSLKKQPIVLHYREEDHNDGLAPHFREYLRMQMTKWCNQHGYDLYRDGLRIYVTLNSKMQAYAEQAVKKHLTTLQKEFYSHWKGRAPWGSEKSVVERSIKMCERYNVLKNDGVSEAEIMKAMNTPVKMRVFSYRGDIDTTMSPIDSIKYYKYFLHTGFMSMDPHIRLYQSLGR